MLAALIYTYYDNNKHGIFRRYSLTLRYIIYLRFIEMPNQSFPDAPTLCKTS